MLVNKAVERMLPVLLPDFEKPVVLTYSLESTVAEKLDAIISLMEATGRMKDFYDIYYIATTFDVEGRKLQEAIYETLSNRGTSLQELHIRFVRPKNVVAEVISIEYGCEDIEELQVMCG